MNKVIKILLISEQYDKDGNSVDYKTVNEILLGLQRATREIKNKTIQLCWEYEGFSSDYKEKYGIYPNKKDVLGYTLIKDYIYNQLKDKYCVYSSNLNMSIRETCIKFKNDSKEITAGMRSIASYKSDQPLDLHTDAIKLGFDGAEYWCELGLLNKSGKKKYNLKDNFRFKMLVKDNSTRVILQRCIDKIYKVSASKLKYNKKKKKWELALSYAFTPEKSEMLDENKILGVDLGMVCPVTASVYGSPARLTIRGDKITAFRKQVEARRNQLLRQGRYCGDGRIGHGIKTRNKPAYSIEDKIARFRDTENHIMSRALIDYAVKNNCGTIQMEDLTGVTEEAGRFLKNWTYFDLQSKIKYKADEVGIKVVKIKPQYTSQRCSKCGFIDTNNRKIQSEFRCMNPECGFTENADYNASQNISIKNIDKIIEKEYNKTKKENAKRK